MFINLINKIKESLNPAVLESLFLGFIISIILGIILIPVLHKLKFGQNIRESGPKSHIKKAGIPTIGGLIFILSVIISIKIVFFSTKINSEVRIVLLSFILFGFIGFLDDILKIIHKNNLGLKSGQKMILLLILSIPLSYYIYITTGASIHISFTNTYVSLGSLYIPLVVIYFTGMTNAVNLTDGLDGLATLITILVSIFFFIISYITGHISLSIFCIILSGALLGFLVFNAYPAKVFMGDTGSLALGGALSAIALLLKMPLLLFIVGGIYIIETLSVILQVASYKLRGKRIFKMAPIHHHFEFKWSEVKIVAIFSIITIIFCGIGFVSILSIV
nr:phospho-N-acetylmuramoyl-pentapeptide-transferase [Clostridium gasigenes]